MTTLTSHDSTWEKARHILCVRLDTIGDLLMTTPALRALKTSAPDRHLTLLTSPAAASAASLVPEVDDILEYEAPWIKASGHRETLEHDDAMITVLRALRFDAAVIFTVYSQNPLPSAFLCFLAGIPLRLAHSRENPYQLLTHWVPESEPAATIRHEVRRQLDLVAMVGARTDDETLSLQVPESVRAGVPSLLTSLGIDGGRPWIMVHPGATAPSRRYPPELFAEVVRRLVREEGYQILLTGSAEERELLESIRSTADADPSVFVGILPLPEFCAVAEASPLVITNNTGPAHIAAALGTPVVDLYALTNPQHFPWMVPHRVLFHDVACRWCYKSVCPEQHHNCLRLVAPADVVDAALTLLKGSRKHVHARYQCGVS